MKKIAELFISGIPATKYQKPEKNSNLLLVRGLAPSDATKIERRIKDCKSMFAPHIHNTIATYLVNLKHVDLVQQCRLLLCLNAHTCLLLKPLFWCFEILCGYVLLFKYIWHCTCLESLHHAVLPLAVLCTYLYT